MGGQLLTLNFVFDDMNYFLYFQNHYFESKFYKDPKYDFLDQEIKKSAFIKTEYPYTLFLNQKNYQVLPKIRETIEEKGKGIGILNSIVLDYNVPVIKKGWQELFYPELCLYRHRFYVIHLRYEEDKILLKLLFPEFVEISMYDEENSNLHENSIREYFEHCQKNKQINFLKTQQEKFEYVKKYIA